MHARTGAIQRLAAAVLILWVVVSCQFRDGARNTPSPLTLSTADGHTFSAMLYVPAALHPPGCVLVHGVGGNLAQWSAFAQRLREAGVMTIAMTLRGHEEGEARAYRRFSPEEWLACTQEIEAAMQALGQQGAALDRRVVIGADIGANLALRYAAEAGEVSAAILVSPGLDIHGVRTQEAMRAIGQRPVLMLTSKGDAYSASSCRALKAVASGQCELREYDGSAHGIDLLETNVQSTEQILQWLESVLQIRRE